MTQNEIYERLNKIFRETFDDDSIEVTARTSALDIDDWDSVNHIALVAEIEQQFGIKLDVKTIAGLNNVGDIVKAVENNVERNSESAPKNTNKIL